jgi:hypothetical protein
VVREQMARSENEEAGARGRSAAAQTNRSVDRRPGEQAGYVPVNWLENEGHCSDPAEQLRRNMTPMNDEVTGRLAVDLTSFLLGGCACRRLQVERR